jgi:hypothetical protein
MTPPQTAEHSVSQDSYRPSAADLDRLDKRLDEALEETFPASDPVALTPVRQVEGSNR